MRKFIAIAAATVLVLASCKDKVPQVAILSDNTFVDGEATLTLLLSSSTSSDVTVGLTYIEKNSTSSKALPGSAVRFGSPVTISAGSVSAKIKVYVDEAGIADGNYHAIISLSYAQGAEISRTNQAVIYVKIGSDAPPVSDLTYMNNWSVKVDAFPYPYPSTTRDHIDLIATVPDINYFWVESNTQADLDKYYGGSVEGLISYFSNEISTAVAGGESIADQCWNASEANIVYADYWAPGQTTFYIMEFDASGKATGRYGTTDITLNDYLPFTNKTGTWTLTYDGVRSYPFSDGNKDAEFFNVGGTGSVPFSFILEDSGIIKDEDDLLIYIREDFYNYYAQAIAEGSTAADLYYTGAGSYCSLYQACQGQFDAYIIGHDSSTCLPSGDYAKCSFTDTDGPAPATGSISARPRRIGTPLSTGRNAVKTKLLHSAR